MVDPFGTIQPRFVEPILHTDDVPSDAFKKGSAYRKGTLVLFQGKPRYILNIRTRAIESLVAKVTVTEVFIAEGWMPISKVELKKV